MAGKTRAAREAMAAELEENGVAPKPDRGNILVALGPELRGRLELLAGKVGGSMAFIVRKIVETHLAEYEQRAEQMFG